MTETFVPLVVAVAATREDSFTALNLKTAPGKFGHENGRSAVTPPPPAHSPEACAKPTVTLQRNGDVVTSIRVQCGCGEVIELSCVY